MGNYGTYEASKSPKPWESRRHDTQVKSHSSDISSILLGFTQPPAEKGAYREEEKSTTIDPYLDVNANV